jgi:hypothetical protein
MKRHGFTLAALPCLLVLGFALARPAGAEMCSAICSTSVLCTTSCEVCARGADNQDGSCTNGTVWSTCGNQGFPCASCLPNWQEYSRIQRGVFQRNYFFYCNQYRVDDVYWTDTNHCQPNHISCEEVQIGSAGGVNVSCCNGSCWGKQGC